MIVIINMKHLLLLLVLCLSSCVYYDDGNTRAFDILPTQPTYYQPYILTNRMDYGYVPACFNTYPQPHYHMRPSW